MCVRACACVRSAVNDFIQGDVIADIIGMERQQPREEQHKTSNDC